MNKPYLQLTLDDIIEDAKKKPEKLLYLKDIAQTEMDGKKISFLELKRAYCLRFYPKSVPVKAEKETMWDRIAEL